MTRERQYLAAFGYPEGKVRQMYFYAESAELARDHATVLADRESDEEQCYIHVLSVRRLPKSKEVPNDWCGEFRDYVYRP